jgi:hypothetical protein
MTDAEAIDPSRYLELPCQTSHEHFQRSSFSNMLSSEARQHNQKYVDVLTFANPDGAIFFKEELGQAIFGASKGLRASLHFRLLVSWKKGVTTRKLRRGAIWPVVNGPCACRSETQLLVSVQTRWRRWSSMHGKRRVQTL